MKYLGSKNRLAKQLLSVIPRDENQIWVEPFCGGCGMMRNVTGPRVGADNNKYIIALLKAIQQGWTAPESLTKEEYNHIRYNNDEYDPALVAFAAVGCSFGGAWFNGYANSVNGRNYIDESRRAVLKLAPKIQDVKFIHCDYKDLELPENSIIYCDPPYKDTKGYKDEFNHGEFYEWCRQKFRQGHQIYISEFSAPEDFKCILEIEKTNSFDSFKSKKQTEKLFQFAGPKS